MIKIGVNNLYDIWMIKSGKDSGFSFESIAKLFISYGMRCYCFQHNASIEAIVCCKPNLTHSTSG